MEELINQMRQWLTQEGFHVIRAMHNDTLPRLQNFLIAVGTGEIRTQDATVCDYLGKDAAGSLYYGRPLRAELTFEICSTWRQGAAGCDGAAVSLLKALRKDEAPFHCTDISLGRTSFDPKANCFRRTVTAAGPMWMYYACRTAESGGEDEA